MFIIGFVLPSLSSLSLSPLLALPQMSFGVRSKEPQRMSVGMLQRGDPLHPPLLGFCFFSFFFCCIINLYCILQEEYPIKLWKKKKEKKNTFTGISTNIHHQLHQHHHHHHDFFTTVFIGTVISTTADQLHRYPIIITIVITTSSWSVFGILITTSSWSVFGILITNRHYHYFAILVIIMNTITLIIMVVIIIIIIIPTTINIITIIVIIIIMSITLCMHTKRGYFFINAALYSCFRFAPHFFSSYSELPLIK